MKTETEPRFKHRGLARKAVKAGIEARITAGNAYRVRVQRLLSESTDEQLAGVWQQVCPFPLGMVFELPDRGGMIEDLADFIEVLRPRLDGMRGHRLCRLVANYAGCNDRQANAALLAQ